MSETPRQLIVLLGASNLAFSMQSTLDAIGQRCDHALLYIACGPGRSYGLRTGNPIFQYEGISRSSLWQDLKSKVQADPDLKVTALITDIGNDLLYCSGYRQVLKWLAHVMDHLRAVNGTVGITAPPLESVKTLGYLRFHVLRRLFFPGSKVKHEETLQWLDQLDQGLVQMTVDHGAHYLRVEPHWYGHDRFHIKASKRREALNLWFDTLLGEARTASHVTWESLPGKRRYWFLGRPRRSEINHREIAPGFIAYCY